MLAVVLKASTYKKLLMVIVNVFQVYFIGKNDQLEKNNFHIPPRIDRNSTISHFRAVSF